MSVLFFHTMRYKADDPRNQCNDRFVLSKVGVQYFLFCWSTSVGQFVWDLVTCAPPPHSHVQGHAAPILYAAWAEAGFVKESDLLNLRKIDCDLEGHPTPVGQKSGLVLEVSLKKSMRSLVDTPLSLFTPEIGFCWCGYRVSGTGSWGCLWDGLHWEILWQIQVSGSQTFCDFIKRL